MRITPDQINSCPQFINAIKQRQLDMRGLKIPMIENLGATMDFYDCLDMSDNEIISLSSFSIQKNLSSLILTNNRISNQENISDAFPNLENLILMGNKITDLKEIDNLAYSKNLKRLYLANNVVTNSTNYRLYIIHRLPGLKVLDFQKVKHTERISAKEIFGEFVLPNQKDQLMKMSKNEKLKMAIDKAGSMEEINRLEFLLKSGELSESILDQKLIEYKIF